jgi:predicted MFS family arabinose efflux permease
MSMLSGIVFLSHQLGSFMGAWLGGALFEATGSYQLVWWITVALGLFAAAVNLPVRDVPLPRGAAQPA